MALLRTMTLAAGIATTMFWSPSQGAELPKEAADSVNGQITLFQSVMDQCPTGSDCKAELEGLIRQTQEYGRLLEAFLNDRSNPEKHDRAAKARKKLIDEGEAAQRHYKIFVAVKK